MKFIEHLSLLNFNELIATRQKVKRDWENVEWLEQRLVEFKRLVPAFHKLLGIFNAMSKDLPLGSNLMIGMEGELRMFYTLILFAEEHKTDEYKSSNSQSNEESKWLERLIEINIRRNAIEKKLRSIVLNFIRYSSLQEKTQLVAKDRILAIIDSAKRGQFANLHAEQIMESNYMWSDLIKLIKKEWPLFERIFADQNEFSKHCDIINDRPDAHAKQIDEADMAMYRRSLKWMEDILSQM